MRVTSPLQTVQYLPCETFTYKVCIEIDEGQPVCTDRTADKHTKKRNHVVSRLLNFTANNVWSAPSAFTHARTHAGDAANVQLLLQWMHHFRHCQLIHSLFAAPSNQYCLFSLIIHLNYDNSSFCSGILSEKTASTDTELYKHVYLGQWLLFYDSASFEITCSWWLISNFVSLWVEIIPVGKSFINYKIPWRTTTKVIQK